MDAQFYIVVNGQTEGPFSLDEIKMRKINRDTLVWSEGLAEWVKAENHPLLKDFVNTLPPPLPAQSGTTPPPIPKVSLHTATLSSKYFGYQLASRWQRLFAYLVQSLIILLVLFFLFGSKVFTDNGDFSFQSLVGEIVLGAIIGAIVGAIFYPFWSGNLGHKIFGLKVISSVDGSDYKNAGKGAIREALKEAMGTFIIPILWILWDENKQGLYDKIVKTYVVKKNE